MDKINNPEAITLGLPETDSRVDNAISILNEYGIKCLGKNNLNPATEIYADQFRQFKFTKNWPAENLNEYLSNPIIKSFAMLNNDELSGVVCGCTVSTAEVIRSSIRIIGMDKESKNISSIFLMISKDYRKIFAFGDCAVIPEPTPEQLAEIAFKSSYMYNLLLGIDPRIAFLSFSTNSSADHYRVKNVQKATEIFGKRYPDIIHDGEIQLDAAINPIVATAKNNNNTKLNGDANILIFPNLDAGNIGYKLAQYFGGYFACGPLLLGLKKNVNDLSRGATVDDIVLTSLITALQWERKDIANL